MPKIIFIEAHVDVMEYIDFGFFFTELAPPYTPLRSIGKKLFIAHASVFVLGEFRLSGCWVKIPTSLLLFLSFNLFERMKLCAVTFTTVIFLINF